MFFRHHGGDSTLLVYVASPHHQITSKNMFFEVKILTHSWDFLDLLNLCCSRWGWSLFCVSSASSLTYSFNFLCTHVCREGVVSQADCHSFTPTVKLNFVGLLILLIGMIKVGNPRHSCEWFWALKYVCLCP